jgi:transposase
MSTSILYHVFRVRDYRYLRSRFIGGEVIFHIEKVPEKLRCGGCFSRNVIKYGRVTRRIRTVPAGSRRVWLMLHLHRLRCRDCLRIGLEPLSIAFPKKHWSKALARYILELLKFATVKDVASHLGMSWDTVKEIHAWALKQRFKKRRIKHLRYLGVDEVAVRRGHRYMTVVVDLLSGEVVWIGEGRETSSLGIFLRRLKKAGAPIQGIAMDMWPAYIRAVMEHYPANMIVFDRYHVISDYNRMIDELRRREAAAAPMTEKQVYVGVRYLLLKGEEKIKNSTAAKEKLDRLLSLNRSLNIAYVLKEELRAFWNCQSRGEAEIYLANWVKKAWASGIMPLMKFANKLAAHRYGLLNYFEHRITTAKVEGINNKIKVLKRMAYGFRDMEYFKLRIYFMHHDTYSLIG